MRENYQQSNSKGTPLPRTVRRLLKPPTPMLSCKGARCPNSQAQNRQHGISVDWGLQRVYITRGVA